MRVNILEKTFRDIGSISRVAIAKGLTDFQMCMDYVQQLPYGRNANRQNLSLVLTENKGSCSSKHALLTAIAEEQSIPKIQLILCVYKMNQSNTPGIGSHIKDIGLEYIPEAHCFLRIDGIAHDLTSASSSISRISNAILKEEVITSMQVSEYKVSYHQKFIQGWIAQNNISKTFEEVWAAREKCIASLSTTATNNIC